MALNEGLAALGLIYAIFVLLRFDSFNDIWSDVERYETRIEIEFAEYIFERYVAPFESDVESAMEKMTERLGLASLQEELNTDEEQDETETPEEDENSSDDGPDLADFFRLLADEVPSADEVERIMEETVGSVFDVSEHDGLRQTHEAEEADSILIPYLVREGILDPRESLSRSKKFYRQYYWPNRMIIGIKSSMIFSVLALVLSGVVSLANARYMGFPLDEVFFLLAIFLIFVWVALEYILWRFLRRKVIMNEETYAGKLLSPDPRDLL